jgi:ATP-dependent Clp protease ATP-binding subunit ClpC
LGQDFVGTEHILLGLIKLGQGVGVNVLLKESMSLESLRAEVERLIGPIPQRVATDTLPYTPRVKAVFSSAVREAKTMNHTHVGTEHLLLGLLQEKEGLASKALKSFGVDIERTRQAILRELDPWKTEY